MSEIPDLEGNGGEDSNEATDTVDKSPKNESNYDETQERVNTKDDAASVEETVHEEEGATAAATPSRAYLCQASVDLQTDLIYLVRYSLEKEMQQFTEALHECCICFCTKTGKHFVRLNQCRHHFCKECASTYCTEHIKDGTVDSLT